MQTPFKRIIVYDLETGGLSSKYNSITEMAGVAIDTETLEIVEEFSVMIKPRADLFYVDIEPLREAKVLFKNLATKDEETNIKTLQYKGKGITLKSLDEFSEDLEKFNEEFLETHGNIITLEDFQKLEESSYSDIAEVYFNHTYNPQALEVTHISKELLIEEGVEYEEAYKKIIEFFKRHTIGNSKPVIAGHNIKNFDNSFLEKFFESNSDDFYKNINLMMIDTLEWARLRWFEMPSFSLGVCANALGLTLKEAHRALPDTIANANFLIKMLKSLRGEGSQESTYVRKKFKFKF